VSIDSIRTWLRERHITEVECLVPDMTGNARGKIIPAAKFLAEEGMRLPESVLLQTVTGDLADDRSTVRAGEGDMLLRPDPNAIHLVPWAHDPTAQIIHDCFEFDGTPLQLAPRTVLRRVLALYEAEGWYPVVAPELEFFLVKRNTDPDVPLLPPEGRSGRPETGRQSYSIDAVNEFDPLFEEMYDCCDAMELDVDTLIHEAGAAQMEINFLHGDPLDRADQVFLFKRTMREVAMRHGIFATFMAKPMAAEPGSSMHMHESLVNAQGRNSFAEEDGSHTALFRHFIGGQQKYAPAAMSIFAPNVNSYRRITRNLAAPINVQWGFDNRSCGLRIPDAAVANTRVEIRFAGADANPYLAVAVSLACGYLGMREQLEPTAPVSGDAYQLPYQLPRNLEAALALLYQCEPLHTILGERFVRAYIAVKEKEYETFLRVISSWEREFLLLNV
jgi:glutamine synthetase